MKQLTTEESIALHDSGAWKAWTDHQKAHFQMVQDKLCMPFGEFHRCMEVVLGRPVWTHEFAQRDRLLAEMLGRAEAPSMDDIMAQIPADKLLVVRVPTPSTGTS